MPFCFAVTQYAWSKSVGVGGEEANVGPKVPWRGVKFVGERRMFSGLSEVGVLSRWRGIGLLRAMWVVLRCLQISI